MTRDWTQFTRRITVDCSPQTIYDVWAIPSQIERWFLRSAQYVDPDGETHDHNKPVGAGCGYSWRWFGYPDDVSEYGKIVEANGLDRFGFTFTQDSLVSVSLIEEMGEVVVELTQSRIPEDENRDVYVDCSYGWTFFLANLKSVLEGGHDLRNRSLDVKNVINS